MDEMTGSATPPRPRDKAELLSRMRRSRALLEETIGRLSEAQLTAPGPTDGWSVKDHLAHLTAWEQGIVALLQQRPRYPAMGLDEAAMQGADEQRINAMLYARSKDRPLAEVLTTFRASSRQMIEAVERLTDADLFRTYAYFQPNEPGEDRGRPIIAWIIGNTYAHYDEHRAWIEELIVR